MSGLPAILVTGLASWRAAYALVYEDGPGRAFYRLRQISGIIHGDDGHAVGWYNDWTPLRCVPCTSLWTALVLSLLPEKVRNVLAAGAIALLVVRLHQRLDG